MRLLSQKFEHRDTGIKFKVWFEYKNLEPHAHDATPAKKIRVDGSGERDKGGQFIFNRSDPETITKVGLAFQEIGEFCEGLSPGSYVK